MADVLENILIGQKTLVEKAKKEKPIQDLEEKAREQSTRGFFAAVSKEGQVSLIAEIKMKSPSAGSIREPFDVAEIAKSFEKGGASALSVLTEPHHFGGRVENLQKAKEACTLPILRKDFIFDPYQIVEAKAFGADAILLIAEMLSAKQLDELVECALDHQVEPLVEIFSSEALPAVINTKAKMVGINTRNLRTLEMIPHNILNLSRLIPRDRTLVAESGFKTPEEIDKLKSLRISAVLVGESLLRQDNLEEAVKKLVSAAQKK